MAGWQSSRYVHWLRLIVGASWALCSYIGGLLAVASVFSKYGFVWHADFLRLIQEYREHIYPIFDRALEILSAWLHVNFRLESTVKDIIALFGLASSAANSESLILDKRPLFRNITISIMEMLRSSQMYPARGTQMFKPRMRSFNFGMKLAAKTGAIAAVPLNVGFVVLIWFVTLPLWTKVWLVAGLPFLYLRAFHELAWDVIPGYPSAEDMDQATRNLLQKLSYYVSEFGVAAIVVAFLLFTLPGVVAEALLLEVSYAVTIVAYLALYGSIYLVLSPLIAWRSTLIMLVILAIAISGNAFL